MHKRFGVTAEHVKVTDTADVVKRMRGELMLAMTFNPNEAANEIAPTRPACALCSQTPTRSSGDHGPNVARTPRQLGRPH